MIINEIVANLFTVDGVKNFLPRYTALLGSSTSKRNPQHMGGGKAAVRFKYEMNEIEKQIHAATKEMFVLFKLIVSTNIVSLADASAVVTQRALHQYMFKLLFKIDCDCRNLLALGAGIAKHKSIATYLKHLQTKYALTQDDFHYLSLEWIIDEGRIYDGLIQEKLKLQTFDVDKNACFQVYDQNLDPQVTYDERLYVESRLIVSKYYFAIQILSIFRHLDLMTNLLALETRNAGNSCEVDIQPVKEISVFSDAVKELCNIDV